MQECVSALLKVGKKELRREKVAPKVGGKPKKEGGRLFFDAHFIWGPPIYLPCILALDPLLWPIFHLSLASIPVV